MIRAGLACAAPIRAGIAGPVTLRARLSDSVAVRAQAQAIGVQVGARGGIWAGLRGLVGIRAVRFAVGFASSQFAHGPPSPNDRHQAAQYCTP
ncbi:hypothetical protein, partial [Kribbella sp.]|uniref:hypothetical protein n=1 Tax=Kribbella sp. TaxID=1871183 RepID=UPI002D423C0D